MIYKNKFYALFIRRNPIWHELTDIKYDLICLFIDIVAVFFKQI